MMGFNLAKIVAAAIKKKLVEMVSEQEDGTDPYSTTYAPSQPTVEDMIVRL